MSKIASPPAAGFPEGFDEGRLYDLVLANPPFKGAIDAADVNPSLPVKCKKTEILFLHLFARLLENGGRAAVIVPDGVLFGSSRAHVEVRKKLIEENRLDAVVSMPWGVFRPYAGVSTAVLVFTRGAATDKIWFYDTEHDGFSLDDKRQKVAENDIPDLLECWKKWKDVRFQQKRPSGSPIWKSRRTRQRGRPRQQRCCRCLSSTSPTSAPALLNRFSAVSAQGVSRQAANHPDCPVSCFLSADTVLKVPSSTSTGMLADKMRKLSGAAMSNQEDRPMLFATGTEAQGWAGLGIAFLALVVVPIILFLLKGRG